MNFIGGKFTSSDGRWSLIMQFDGNLVLYSSSNAAVWDTKTFSRGTGPFRLAVQEDGNLVVYQKGTCSPSDALWASHTSGRGQGPYELVLQNDRNVVLYDARRAVIWSTDTWLR
jgi:DNA-binding beta-propeller fold protein YncE